MSAIPQPCQYPLRAPEEPLPNGRQERGWTQLAALLVALALIGCSAEDPPVRRSQTMAMGTVVELSLHGVDRARTEAAQQRVTDLLAEHDRRYSAWGEGRLAELNRRLVAGEAASVPTELRSALRRAAVLSADSGGRFNPALGRLVELWGFHDDEPPEAPPPRARIEALLPAPAADSVAPVDGRLSPDEPLRIDLGGFAKGLAIDRALAELRAMDIDAAIVNLGGDLGTIGHPKDRPWRIGVRDPRGEGVLASLTLEGDEAVFTSGDYERYFRHEGRRYHHILDPATGYPARGLRSVTVVTRDAIRADAAATALFVAGPEHWRETARAMGIRHAMLLDSRGTLHVTPALAEKVRIEAEDPPPVRESEPLS